MPKGKQIRIILKRNAKDIVLHPNEEVQFHGKMVIVVHKEVLPKKVKVGRVIKKEIVIPEQVMTPVQAIPIDDVERIDFGYVDGETFQKMLKEWGDKMAAEKAKVEAEEVKKELKPGEKYPGEFEEKDAK